MAAGSDNVNHFFEQLDKRLGRIEMAIDRIGTQHDIFEERLSARVATLELALARQDGGRVNGGSGYSGGNGCNSNYQFLA
jgi:hypothetical protein